MRCDQEKIMYELASVLLALAWLKTNCIVQLFPSNENPILYFLNIYNFVIIVKYVFPSKHTCIHDVYIYVWYVNIKFDPITVRAVNVSDEWRLQLRKFTDL